MQNIDLELESVVELFMKAPVVIKEAYAALEIERFRFGESRKSMTHLLLWHNPRIMMLPERWVDALLAAEQELLCVEGMCNLMYLLTS